MAKQEFAGYSPACLQDVRTRLSEVGASPNEEIGQHFLVNQEVIDSLAQTVNPGSSLIEVGCGVGHITERLAQKAAKVYGIEIDRRYRPLLDKLTDRFTNLTVIYRDTLALDFDKLWRGDRQDDRQIVASLPYHIIEPFMQKIAPLRLASATLVVGRRYADSIAASANSGDFGRLSILTSTFFDTETLATIQRDCFFPIPRTDSAMVQLRPRDSREVGTNKRDAVFKHLFLTSRRNTTLRKGLKEGFDAFEQSKDGVGLSKRERSRKARYNTRQRLREILEQASRGGTDNEGQSDASNSVSSISRLSRNAIERLDIPNITLDKPFALLNNSELRILYTALE